MKPAEEAARELARVVMTGLDYLFDPDDRESALALIATHALYFLTTREAELQTRIAELEAEKSADPSCMEAEHGGHPTCLHIEEAMAELRAEVERLTKRVEELVEHVQRTERVAPDLMHDYRRAEMAEAALAGVQVHNKELYAEQVVQAEVYAGRLAEAQKRVEGLLKQLDVYIAAHGSEVTARQRLEMALRGLSWSDESPQGRCYDNCRKAGLREHSPACLEVVAGLAPENEEQATNLYRCGCLHGQPHMPNCSRGKE